MPTMPERLATLEADMATVKTVTAETRADVKILIADRNIAAGRISVWTAIGRIVPWAALVGAIAGLIRGAI